MITADADMKKIISIANDVASSKAAVLITGESGCGKELLAQFIHQSSIRSKNNFIAVNCAAVPEGLLESELFGYEKGAFTGATQRKIGKFELANDGTFLLDEISEMPLSLQAKILRVIQENELVRLGGNITTKINVRIIATTNKDLAELVNRNLFRGDLFYRLNVVPLRIPPLRERPKDIEVLAKHFTEQSCLQNNRPTKLLSDSAVAKILNYQWPGNIRELQNVIERSVLLCPETILQAENILITEFQFKNNEVLLKPGMSIQQAEELLIQKTLEYTGQNKSQAARLLGITVRTLRNKLNDQPETEVL